MNNGECATLGLLLVIEALYRIGHWLFAKDLPVRGLFWHTREELRVKGQATPPPLSP